MAYSYMDHQKVEASHLQWEASETVTGNGTWFIFPAGAKSCAITLTISSGQGYVEATTDNLNSVIAGTATGKTWPPGSVTSTTQELLYNATAFRAVQQSGTVRISAVAK